MGIYIPNFLPFSIALRHFKSMFPDKQAVIAGGAIRDLWVTGDEKHIKDIDVFLLDVKEHEAPALDNHIRNNVYHGDLLYHKIPNYGSYGPPSIYHCPKMRVTIPEVPYICEMMYSPHTTPEELMGGFDWRACQFCYDGSKTLYPGEQDFAEEMLSLNDKILYPKSTLRRGLSLEYKYRQLGRTLRLPKDAIFALVTMMAFK